ncbi:hypothetical protein POTOM_028702 [Populus tomentosa]|uniref:Golgi apparatus membrane protein TVP15 n=1 Tax=Populus tomentosa TaxID=118781 RepID=A0A8X8CV60_POPTO|nr:hypothetical protein POTOM_028702 [Populus tomentosa]
MERNEETVPLPPSPRESLSSLRARSGPDLFLVICRCFSVVTALTAILCIAVNLLSAIQSFKNGSDVFDGIFRCYAVIIAVIVVVAETEWGFIIKYWKVLEYWVGRGMLQIFVAVMTRAFPDYSSKQKQLVILENVASYLLLACGVVYVVLGILCIGCLKRAHQKKKTTRVQAIKDLEMHSLVMLSFKHEATYPKSLHIIPSSRQFDKLLGTDHLVAPKDLTGKGRKL